MKSRSTLLLAAAFVLSSTAAFAAETPPALSDGPEAEASLYGQSVTLPRQAAVCAERIAGYAPRFQTVYDAWRSQNEARIANGSRVVHEQAKAGGVDADEGMRKLADADVERLRKTSDELLARHCQLMLDSLAPPQ